MSDPITPNVGLYVQTTGSNVGTWGGVDNANYSVVDSLAANVATLNIGSLSSPYTLTTPPNTGSSWSGPYQSQSGIIRVAGSYSANFTIIIPRSGYFIFDNQTTGNSYVYSVIVSGGSGNVISLPPYTASHVFSDGTNMSFVNLPMVGTYWDIAITQVPAWIGNCTIPPWLNCDGSTFSATTYPYLDAILGGTTLPDLRGRVRAALNQTTSRITTAGSGVDGNTILSSGGSQNEIIANSNLPASIPYTDPGHVHDRGNLITVNSGSPGPTTVVSSGSGSNTGSSNTGITINNGGANTPLVTLPPIVIAGLTLIRSG